MDANLILEKARKKQSIATIHNKKYIVDFWQGKYTIKEYFGENRNILVRGGVRLAKEKINDLISCCPK